MTATLEDVTKKIKPKPTAEQLAAEDLVRQAPFASCHGRIAAPQLGSDPARFPAELPACYRASWQLPGPDFHRQATTSLRTASSAATSPRRLPLCWAHKRSRLGPQRPEIHHQLASST
jgi:hypothetical protein